MTALLTEAEAAEALRVCTRTLRKARQRGQLSYVLIGRIVRYAQSDLDSFIERSRECQPTNAPRPTRRSSAARPGKVVPFSARQ